MVHIDHEKATSASSVEHRLAYATREAYIKTMCQKILLENQNIFSKTVRNNNDRSWRLRGKTELNLNRPFVVDGVKVNESIGY